MLALFLEFLDYITTHLTDFTSTEAKHDTTKLQTVFEIYTLFHRIADYSEYMADVLVVWRRDKFHGSAWAGSHGYIRNISQTLHLLDRDLHDFIRSFPDEQRAEAHCRFRGGPYPSKFDVFDIWLRIIEGNAEHHFCGWISDYNDSQWKKTLYFPEYSLLLPTVTRTSQLADPTKSRWNNTLSLELRKMIKDPLKQMNECAIGLLPEFPSVYPITQEGPHMLAKSEYAMVVVVPEQDQQIVNIIELAHHDIASFRERIRIWRQVLLDSSTEPETLIRPVL